MDYLYFFTLANKNVSHSFFYAFRVISNKTFLQTQIHRQYGTAVNSFFFYLSFLQKSVGGALNTVTVKQLPRLAWGDD